MFFLFLSLSLSPASSIAFLSLSPSSAPSPHLMRPHNNTAVVLLFCYLSQTAGSLHSVFLVPFACLLRQGNEYHLEQRPTKRKKKKKQHFVGIVRLLIKEFQNAHDLCVQLTRQRNHMFGGCPPLLSIPVQPGAVSARPQAPAFK